MRHSLNGLWKFAYAPNYSSAIAGFEAEGYDCRGWADIRQLLELHLNTCTASLFSPSFKKAVSSNSAGVKLSSLETAGNGKISADLIWEDRNYRYDQAFRSNPGPSFKKAVSSNSAGVKLSSLYPT